MVVNEIFIQDDVVVHQNRTALIEKELTVDTTRLAFYPSHPYLGILADLCERFQNIPSLRQKGRNISTRAYEEASYP